MRKIAMKLRILKIKNLPGCPDAKDGESCPIRNSFLLIQLIILIISPA
jgi:hypothetical protein